MSKPLIERKGVDLLNMNSIIYSAIDNGVEFQSTLPVWGATDSKSSN